MERLHDRLLTVDDLEFYYDRSEVRVGGRPAVNLRRQEAKLLARLMLRAPRVAFVETVFSDLWPNPADQPYGARRLVDVVMSAVRGKIRGSRVNIVTVKRVGWYIDGARCEVTECR